jgi:hypothetical protein
MFIHRPEALLKNETNKEDIITERNWKNLAQIVVEKHRNGPTGIVDLTCWIEYGRFSSREQNNTDIPAYIANRQYDSNTESYTYQNANINTNTTSYQNVSAIEEDTDF